MSVRDDGRTVVATAPGKLFVTGEYAVTEPEWLGVLIAVDRRLRVVLDSAAEPADLPGHGWSYVAASRLVMERLALAEGREIAHFRVRTFSDLHDPDPDGFGPLKYGLGSSAAVTAAMVTALDDWYGLELSLPERLRAGLLATYLVNPAASGADVATCLAGGWVAYSSPVRGGDGPPEALAPDELTPQVCADLVRRDWPGLTFHSLPTPSFAVDVGWTGRPASTMSLVAAVRASGGIPAEFLTRADEASRALVAAIENDDSAGALAAVSSARANLVELGAVSGVAIETPQLTALVNTAEALGFAAKSSGAGGGDCGIAVGAADAPVGELRRAWQAEGIRPMGLRIASGARVEPPADRNDSGYHASVGSQAGGSHAVGSGASDE